VTAAESAPGSEIVLTYVLAEPLMDDIGRAFHGLFTGLAARIGEPFQTLFTPEEAEGLVRRCGLEVADHPTRDDLHARFFAGRADDLRPIDYEQALAARVPG
jgi:O-methyltransferase involved in polyketide biosynthesis